MLVYRLFIIRLKKMAEVSVVTTHKCQRHTHCTIIKMIRESNPATAVQEDDTEFTIIHNKFHHKFEFPGS